MFADNEGACGDAPLTPPMQESSRSSGSQASRTASGSGDSQSAAPAHSGVACSCLVPASGGAGPPLPASQQQPCSSAHSRSPARTPCETPGRVHNECGSQHRSPTDGCHVECEHALRSPAAQPDSSWWPTRNAHTVSLLGIQKHMNTSHNCV